MAFEEGSALAKAHEALVAKRAAGGLGGKVSFTAEEIDVLTTAAKRTDLKLVNEDGKDSTSFRVYVKTVVMAQAAIDAAKPVKERVAKTPEDIAAEIAKLQERYAKMTAG